MSKHDQIAYVVKNARQEGEFNGAILVAQRGNIIFDTAIGLANPVTKAPLTSQSAFYIASLSKQFTAMGIMLLHKQHLLSYDDSIAMYFPQLPAYAKTITIRHLLNHTSGLKDYFESDSLVKPRLSNQQVLQWLSSQQQLRFAPGTEFAYSNTGYVLLALIIEKVTAKPLSAWMQETIFGPLQMTRTIVYDTTMPPMPDRAIGLNKEGQPDDYSILTTGDGGIFSTTHDLFLWDQALYHDTSFSRVVQQAFTHPSLSFGHFSNYGFGWKLGGLRDRERVVYHTGELNGYQALIWRNQKLQQTIILLSNQGSVLQMRPLANLVLDILDSSKARME
jgi:CubicO group peptidase (beta-lactamase class C family)